MYQDKHISAFSSPGLPDICDVIDVMKIDVLMRTVHGVFISKVSNVVRFRSTAPFRNADRPAIYHLYLL